MDRSFLGLRRLWYAAIFALGVASGGEVWPQEWARKMFDHFSHDFGVLVRGQKAEHSFPFRNLYVEDVEIESITSTCGCTIPEVTKRLLKTHETAEIIARANTVQFLGHKEATLRVRFSKPFPAEVQLHCYMYIRTDIVFEPGAINFGTVTAGKESQAVTITASHLTRGDWRILKVQAPEYMQVSLMELSRQPGRVSYQLQAKLLPTAPVGYIRDTILVATNDVDSRLRNLYVQVEGVVAPPISVRPSPLMIGLVNPGQKILRKLVVQGQAPFRIVSVEVPSEAYKVQFAEESSQVQLIALEFTVPDQPGKIRDTIRIHTDLPSDGLVEVVVIGEILKPEKE
jgi:hypothetical protein